MPFDNYLNKLFKKVAMDNSFISLLWKCLYLMLPAYFANMAPVIVKKINLFNYPIDMNTKLNKKPLLGSHKTFRGFAFGVAFAILIAYLQSLLYENEFFRNMSFFSYQNWLLLGFLMGFGALAGDAIKSFFKRRVGIKPGHKFVPFDQIDFALGALLLVAPFFHLTIEVFMLSVLLTFALHIAVNHVAFYLKIRNEKW